MITLEFKLKGKAQQYRVIDEMIRTAQFVRNKTLKYWTENQGVKLIDLYKQCAIMAKEFEWAGKLNSMARQASAERAIFAIQRFFANCKAKKPGKKGYPQFKKHTRSVEYKTSGWSLLDRDHNAAKNILAKGLKARAGINLNTAGHAEINAWGQTDLYSLVVTST
ncbi:hypothetical protein L2I57_023415, partial [Tychonema sp. BBK16]